jgi:hypothetical protein
VSRPRRNAADSVEAWILDNPDRLLTNNQAALFLGYEPQTLRKLRMRNQGPKWQVLENGYSVRYRLGELKRYAGLRVSA